MDHVESSSNSDSVLCYDSVGIGFLRGAPGPVEKIPEGSAAVLGRRTDCFLGHDANKRRSTTSSRLIEPFALTP